MNRREFLRAASALPLLPLFPLVPRVPLDPILALRPGVLEVNTLPWLRVPPAEQTWFAEELANYDEDLRRTWSVRRFDGAPGLAAEFYHLDHRGVHSAGSCYRGGVPGQACRLTKFLPDADLIRSLHGRRVLTLFQRYVAL